MKTYLISLLGAAFLAAAIGILSPEGSGGIGKHVRLLSVLVLLCVIAAPLPRAWVRLHEFTAELPDGGSDAKQEFNARANDALDTASRAYFASALVARLIEKFSLRQSEITCAIVWAETDGEARPARVTLILTGSARWHDPHELERYVTDLLGCPCDTAIA